MKGEYKLGCLEEANDLLRKVDIKERLAQAWPEDGNYFYFYEGEASGWRQSGIYKHYRKISDFTNVTLLAEWAELSGKEIPLSPEEVAEKHAYDQMTSMANQNNLLQYRPENLHGFLKETARMCKMLENPAIFDLSDIAERLAIASFVVEEWQNSAAEARTAEAKAGWDPSP